MRKIIVTILLFFLNISSNAYGVTINADPNWGTGELRGHIQGIATDLNNEYIYWSFRYKLIKTDLEGNLIEEKYVLDDLDGDNSTYYHWGDLTYCDDKIYVAVERKGFNGPEYGVPFVYCYDAADLSLCGAIEIKESMYGVGAIGCGEVEVGENEYENMFVIAGGLLEKEQKNSIFFYDSNFIHKDTIEIDSGYTKKGIQTIAYDADKNRWFLGCYGGMLFQLSIDFTTTPYDVALEKSFENSDDNDSGAYGISSRGDGTFYISSSYKDDGYYTATASIREYNKYKGLIYPGFLLRTAINSIILLQ